MAVAMASDVAMRLPRGERRWLSRWRDVGDGYCGVTPHLWGYACGGVMLWIIKQSAVSRFGWIWIGGLSSREELRFGLSHYS